MAMLILGVLVLAALVLGTATVVGSFQVNRDAKIKSLTAERNAEEKKVQIAERGLRQIANGISGNPVIDAQVTLDDISNVKELN